MSDKDINIEIILNNIKDVCSLVIEDRNIYYTEYKDEGEIKMYNTLTMKYEKICKGAWKCPVSLTKVDNIFYFLEEDNHRLMKFACVDGQYKTPVVAFGSVYGQEGSNLTRLNRPKNF